MREFRELDPIDHERLRFSMVTTSPGANTVFRWNDLDQNEKNEVLAVAVLAELEANEEWNDILPDFLNRCNAAFFKCRLKEIHIPDSVRVIYEGCFYGCWPLARVTFGELSSLKAIGVLAFYKCIRLTEIHIPDSVEVLGSECFAWCNCLSSVTFGESSSLKEIGERAFRHAGLEEIRIPDSVEEIFWNAFGGCDNLHRVTFGESSSLKKSLRIYSLAGTLRRFLFQPDSKEF